MDRSGSLEKFATAYFNFDQMRRKAMPEVA